MLKHPLLYVWVVVIGALVSAGLLRPASDMQGIGQANNKAQQTQAQSAATNQPQPAGVEQDQAGASPYAADCNKPKDHEAADLCQQIRMADAAEAQNRINRIGLGALVATLAATMIAAYAAWRTVHTVRITAERQLRAYVFPTVVRLAGFAAGAHPDVHIKMKNTGQTPAYDVVTRSSLLVADVTIEQAFPVIPSPPYLSRTSIGPGAEVEVRPSPGVVLDATDHAAVIAGTKAIYLVGRVDYMDAFKKARFLTLRLMFTKDNARRGDGAMGVCAEGNDAN